jgi:hypothetical protein
MSRCGRPVRPVRFNSIGDEAAVDDDSLHSSAPGEIDQPAQRFHLHPAQFRLLAESRGQFHQSGRMDPWRQIAILIVGRDHQKSLVPGTGSVKFRFGIAFTFCYPVA